MNSKHYENKSDLFNVVPITVKYPCHLLKLLDEIAKAEFKNRSTLLRELAVAYILFKKNSLKL